MMNQVVKDGAQWLQLSRRKLATAAIGALLCLIGYRAVFGANGFLAFHQKQVESQKLQREIESLQKENDRTEQEIKALKSDPQAVEKEARERFGYAREGEKVFKLPQATPVPTNQK